VIVLAAHAHGVQRATRADDGAWTVSTTWDGGRARTVTVHPRQRTRVYLGTDDGLLRSDDGGATWSHHIRLGLPVTAIAPDPNDPDTVYAGTRPAGVQVSHDGGVSFSELDGFRRARRWYWRSPAEPPGFAPFVLGLGVSPTDPDLIVAGVEAGAVVRSTDGGRSWSSHRRRADVDCHDLTFHAHDGDWVYEAGGGGPAVSRDAGDRWEHPLAGMAGRYCMSVTADAERPEVWYVGAAPMAVWPRFWRMPIGHYPGEAHASIYRSSGGARWERLSGGLPKPLDHAPYGLRARHDAPGELLLGLSDGTVWHGHDYGDSWERLPFRFDALRWLAEV
jgi:hypothetical protein